MKDQLAKIRAEALSALESAKDAAGLDALRVKYLGKKGELTAELETLLERGKEGSTGNVEIVITGRDAKDFLKNAADYITQMECVRHPYEKGIAAREGIEF